MRKILIITSVLVLSATIGMSQPLELPLQPSVSSDTNSVKIKLNGSSYFYNYEYFKPYALGYTQPGFSIIPTVEASLGSKLVLGGGVHVKKYWGDTPFGETSPVIFARYEALRNFYVQVGTLENRDGHALSDILYNPLYKIDFKQENGLQIRYYGRRLYAEAWVSWEHYLKAGADDQEHLHAGANIMLKLTSAENPIEVIIPLQNTFQHFGGQINDKTDPLKKMRTIANLSVGVQAAYRLNSTRKVGVLFQAIKLNDNYSFKPFEGNSRNKALSTTMFYRSTNLNLQLGYRYGNRFYSNFGDQIYNDITMDYKEIEEDRGMILGTGSYTTQPYKGVNFRFDAGGFMSTTKSDIDYYYGVGLIFDIQVFSKSNGK